MEKFNHGKATDLNMNRGFIQQGLEMEDPEAKESRVNLEEIQRKQKLKEAAAVKRETLTNKIYECIRDASATEDARAIQDSESNVAQDQKRIIKHLLSQGWSKNEIIYELQRIFGNDILLNGTYLDDERSFVTKVGPTFLFGLFLSTMFLRGRIRARQATELAKMQAAKEPVKFTSKAGENLSKSEKSDLMRKLKLDSKRL